MYYQQIRLQIMLHEMFLPVKRKFDLNDIKEWEDVAHHTS